MRHSIFLFCFAALLYNGCIKGQVKNKPIPQDNVIGNFEYTYKSAHPKAQALMKEEFYWSPIEETAPFGSDDGSDAAYGFREWRSLNKTASPVNYIKELIERWNYPFFDYNETDTTKIKAFIDQKPDLNEASVQRQMQQLKEINKNSADTSVNFSDNQLREIIIASSKGMGIMYLLGQDNAIIGTAFAQFVLEGRMDSDIQSIATTAIRRQMLPLLINRYENKYRDIRREQLIKMLGVVNKANS